MSKAGRSSSSSSSLSNIGGLLSVGLDDAADGGGDVTVDDVTVDDVTAVLGTVDLGTWYDVFSGSQAAKMASGEIVLAPSTG
jgi:hypothetical protein